MGLMLGVLSTRTAIAGNYYNKYYDGDDGYGYGKTADDDFIDLSYQDFDQVSMMPVSCVN